MRKGLTLNLSLIFLRVAHHQRSSLTIQRVVRIRVPQQLRQEHFKDINHICETIIIISDIGGYELAGSHTEHW